MASETWDKLSRRSGRRYAIKKGRSAGSVEEGPYTGEIMRPIQPLTNWGRSNPSTKMGGGYKYNGKTYKNKTDLPKSVAKQTRGHNTLIPSTAKKQAASSAVTVPAAVGGGVVATSQKPETVAEQRAARAAIASRPKKPAQGSIDAVAKSLIQRGQSSGPSRANPSPKREAKSSEAPRKAKVHSSDEVSTPRANPKRGNVPTPKPSPRPNAQSNYDKLGFSAAFGQARGKGLKEFTWRGNRYNTKVKK